MGAEPTIPPGHHEMMSSVEVSTGVSLASFSFFGLKAADLSVHRVTSQYDIIMHSVQDLPPIQHMNDTAA